MADRDEARRLVEEALFLCMYGERPPGAPRDDPTAETWGEWNTRAETFLRATDGADRRAVVDANRADG